MENKINIGEMDTRVEIIRATQGTGSQGEKTWTLESYGRVWAKVERDVVESVESMNLESGHNVRCTIYKIAALTSRWRVRIDGDIYEIESIDPISRVSPLCTLTLTAID